MGKPKRFEKLIRFYIDSDTLEIIKELPGSQSDAIRYLIKLGEDKVSLHHTETAKEVQKLSEIVIMHNAEILRLKEVVAQLVRERNGL